MNQLPEAQLFFLSRKKLVKKSTFDLFKGKDILLIGIPGAFTTTCPEMVRDYENAYDTLTKLGIDDIYFVSINDPYVMDAWWKSMKIKKCKYLPDGNGAFSLRLSQQGGMASGLSVVEKYNKGMGKRSWRFVMFVEDGCQMSFVEEQTETSQADTSNRDNIDEDPYILTRPSEVINMIKARDQASRVVELNKASEEDKGHLPQ
jgi:peroxiredoxin